MGGDAFPSTQRLSEEEYATKCEEVRLVLDKIGVSFGFPVEVADKAEVCKERGKDKPYGDVDLIVALDEKNKRFAIVELVKHAVGLDDGEILKNDTIYSFLSKERFQVDLMFCEAENLEFLLAFESNNDFGALLGHLLTPLKLKWSNLGLVLKLETEEVPGVGTCKDELVLTNNVAEVCGFLGLPAHSLDGRTRLSTSQIFEVLTKTRVFFPVDYDEKYKIRERRKRRPVSDAFFNFLESSEKDLEAEKLKLYKEDELEQIFRQFKRKDMEYREYIEFISDHFNKKEEVEMQLNLLFEKNKKPQGNPKLNFQVLCSWFPGAEPNKVGKILAKVKSKHSGIGKDAFDDWIDKTDIEDIRLEVEQCRDVVMQF